MKWLGSYLRIKLMPPQDAVASELLDLLNGRRCAIADLSATRARLERTASREAAIDNLAEDRK